MQKREAIAYALYMRTSTFRAAAVVAVVLYYGGSLVLAGAMSAGSLVSFMLYQQSLSGAFQVGAAVDCCPGKEGVWGCFVCFPQRAAMHRQALLLQTVQ